MLKRRIIPCLDVKDGRIRKGVHFKGLRDKEDPVEAARAYDRQGADELCLIDISSTHEGRRSFLDVVRRVAPQTFIPLTVGGGIRRASDVAALLEAGADKVAINSAAVANPLVIRRVAKRFGSQSIVAAVDVRRMEPIDADSGPVYEIVTHDGTRGTGLDAIAYCEQIAELGAGEILLTCMDRVFSKDGYDLWITREISKRVSIPVIASGGVGNLEHLREGLADNEGAADGVLAAAIFHFGLFTIAQAKQFLAAHGVPVRPVQAPRAA